MADVRAAPGAPLEDVIRVEEHFYIRATASQVDFQTRVLKDGDTFAVFDRYGDVRPLGLGEQGLYHEGTRHLSRSVLRIGSDRPLFLSSTMREDNALLAVDLTNPDLVVGGDVVVPRGVIHLFRGLFLRGGTCHERLRIRNYGLEPHEIAFSLQFDADFEDIFEVRGIERPRRGVRLADRITDAGVVLAYRGLDGVERRTRIEASPAPLELSGSEMWFKAWLDRGQEAVFHVTVACEQDVASHETPSPDGGRNAAAHGQPVEAARTYDDVFRQVDAATEARRAGAGGVTTSNEQFNDLVNRSLADLVLMVTDTPDGPYPYAGVPWFSTVFGRDGILTALSCLWLYPDLARGVISHLAATQAEGFVQEQDAEPGKILHESRRGEMAALGEIPFGRYYGTVDATPLFVVLAGAYVRQTGDAAFAERLWPHVERALSWIAGPGDPDGDGFVEYARRSEHGLVHQGWKDSQDSVFHADGTPAEAPIALCEVQGYVHAAKLEAAGLASLLGDTARAEALRGDAETLRDRFREAFWCPELGTFALALDGGKRRCEVRTSNAGHCLFTGMAGPEEAAAVARTLLGEDSFSGWGVRTLSSREVRYNPMSYHNGSVWPHDNAIVAAGLARCGFRDEALRILAGLLDASVFLELHRLPELFCGFPRRKGEGPTRYPVACSPQAWASAAPFLILPECLGLAIDGAERRLSLERPRLPEFLQRVELTGIRVGAGTVDVQLERGADGVAVYVPRRDPGIDVVVTK
jgi:glycogen debranching enzyme